MHRGQPAPAKKKNSPFGPPPRNPPFWGPLHRRAVPRWGCPTCLRRPTVRSQVAGLKSAFSAGLPASTSTFTTHCFPQAALEAVALNLPGQLGVAPAGGTTDVGCETPSCLEDLGGESAAQIHRMAKLGPAPGACPNGGVEHRSTWPPAIDSGAAHCCTGLTGGIGLDVGPPAEPSANRHWCGRRADDPGRHRCCRVGRGCRSRSPISPAAPLRNRPRGATAGPSPSTLTTAMSVSGSLPALAV